MLPLTSTSESKVNKKESITTFSYPFVSISKTTQMCLHLNQAHKMVSYLRHMCL